MRQGHARLVALWLVLAAVAVAGCAAMVPPKPKTPAEALYAAEVEYTALLQSAVDLRKAGVIRDSLYDPLDEAFEAARTALDLAWTAYDQGPADGVADYLRQARAALLRARTLLTAGGGS